MKGAGSASRDPCGIAGLAVLLALSACASEGPPPFGEVSLRQNEDLVIGSNGQAIPLFVGVGSHIGLCLEVPATVDSSQWQARLRVAETTVEAPVAARTGHALCFDSQLPARLDSDGEFQVCATIEDLFDGSRWRAPCQEALFRADQDSFLATFERQDEILQRASELGPDEIAALLDGAATASLEVGFPERAVRLELVAVYFLRRGNEAQREEARSRLRGLPAWLESPAAASLAAEVALEEAALELGEAGPEARRRALERLRDAEILFRPSADPLRLTASVLRANVLAQLGLAGEAAEALRAALDGCSSAPCLPATERMAQGSLPWLVALDPLARDEDLELALEQLALFIQGEGDHLSAPEGEVSEQINDVLNRAVLELRLQRDPAATLEMATSKLAELSQSGRGSGSEGRLHVLRGWSNLLLGLAALGRDQPREALAACRRVSLWIDPQLAAAAWSCRGRGYRRLGQISDAAQAFERALAEHTLAAAHPSELGFSQGPGPRAEDVKRLARIEIERGRDAVAWRLLEELDEATLSLEERRRCRLEVKDPEIQARWRKIDGESRQILEELMALEGPTSGRREVELTRVRRALRQRWEELQREWPGCSGASSSTGVSSGQRENFGFRAFALEDEIFLLQGKGEGAATVKRTPFPRRQLLATVDQLRVAMGEKNMDDDTWRALLAPLAEALVAKFPGEDRPGEVGPGEDGSGEDGPEDAFETTPFRLHGILQAVPLAALPISDGGSARWLLDRTLPVLVPAASESLPFAGQSSLLAELGGLGAAGTETSSRGAPLFLVDPTGDLPAAAALAPLYRRLFPGARVLTGEKAARSALGGVREGRSFLHLDAHGRYERAFPELSAILLADAHVPWPDFVEALAIPRSSKTEDPAPELEAPWTFVNLSGCQTGLARWTPDSGRYGLAGLLIQSGVPAVIASRATIADRFAGEMNRAFYQGIAEGETPAGAYAASLRQLTGSFPAAVWSAAMFITSDPGGQKMNSPNPPWADVAIDSRSSREVRK